MHTNKTLMSKKYKEGSPEEEKSESRAEAKSEGDVPTSSAEARRQGMKVASSVKDRTAKALKSNKLKKGGY